MPLAKLCRPASRQAVPRARLFRLLDRIAARPVTWIWGPPGAGKTTLAASYVEARGARGLWYHLDAGDADLASLFFHLAAAAPRRRRPLPPLAPAYRLALSEFTRSFFRELFGRYRPPFCLVLDNHGDGAPHGALDEVLAEGLSQLPPGGRVIVTSRGPPPPSLARLAASQAIALVDAEALRFTPAESRLLLRRLAGAPLAPARLTAMLAQAEGWAAGLVLLAEARPTAPGPASEAGGGSPQVVFDYFAHEVLRHMPGGEREALLEIALLDRPSAPLAEAVTGNPTAGRVLGDLHRRGYFTSAHTQGGTSYRLHPLFRRFLLAEARARLAPERQAALRRAAASALERESGWEEAATLWREAGDLAALGRLVRQQAPVLLAHGRHQTLSKWLADLPASQRAGDPWLGYWSALARQPWDPGASGAELERAFTAFRARADREGACAAWCAAVQTVAYELENLRLLDPWIERLDHLPPARGRFPSRELQHRMVNTALLALTLRRPDHPALARWAARAKRLGRADVEIGQRLEGMCVGMTHHLWCGAPEEAVELAATAQELSRSEEIAPLLRVLAKLLVGRVAWLCAAPADGRAEVAEALALGAAHGIELYRPQLLIESAAMALGDGEEEAASGFLAQLGADPERLRSDTRSQYYAVRAWEALLRGDASSAARAAEQAQRLTEETGMPIATGIAALLRADALHALGRRDDGEALLAQVRATAEATRSALLRWSTGLLEAGLLLERGDRTGALATLRSALAVGCAHALAGCYGWQPARMARLCALALASGVEPAFVRMLIARRGLCAPPDEPANAAWPWPIAIVTLGRFEIRRDGEPIHWGRKPPRKPLQLLRAILALGGRSVREAEVADLLWPDADGDAAQVALATTVHRLRKLLGRDDAIVRQRGRLGLDPRVCWVDAWELESWLDRADASEGEEARAALERALALHGASRLESGADAVPATPSASRIRRRLTRAVEEAARRFQAVGEGERARALLERLAAVDVEGESAPLRRGPTARVRANP